MPSETTRRPREVINVDEYVEARRVAIAQRQEQLRREATRAMNRDHEREVIFLRDTDSSDEDVQEVAAPPGSRSAAGECHSFSWLTVLWP